MTSTTAQNAKQLPATRRDVLVKFQESPFDWSDHHQEEHPRHMEHAGGAGGDDVADAKDVESKIDAILEDCKARGRSHNVMFDVGGVHRITSLASLRREPGSVLTQKWRKAAHRHCDETCVNDVFDRDMVFFDYVLMYLRGHHDKYLQQLPEATREALLIEADHFKMPGLRELLRPTAIVTREIEDMATDTYSVIPYALRGIAALVRKAWPSADTAGAEAAAEEGDCKKDKATLAREALYMIADRLERSDVREQLLPPLCRALCGQSIVRDIVQWLNPQVADEPGHENKTPSSSSPSSLSQELRDTILSLVSQALEHSDEDPASSVSVSVSASASTSVSSASSLSFANAAVPISINDAVKSHDSLVNHEQVISAMHANQPLHVDHDIHHDNDHHHDDNDIDHEVDHREA